MGVVVIVLFLVFLPVVLLATGPASLDFVDVVVMVLMAVMGGGGLLGTLYLIEPERLEDNDSSH